MEGSNINIREVNINDLEIIAKIHVDAWKYNYVDIIPKTILDVMSYSIQKEKWKQRLFTKNNSNEIMYVLEVGNEIKGFSAGVIINDTKAYINAIYFAPNAQRKGYGTQLFNYMIRALKRERIELWCFKENKNRIFYEKLGGKVGEESSRELESKVINEVQYIFEGILQ